MKLLPAKPLHAAALCLALAWSALPLAGVAQDNAMKPTVAGNGGIESALVASLVEVIESRVDDALKSIDTILVKNPNFRLAQMIKGDLLLARMQPISTLGNTSKATSETLDDMRQEARVRLDRYLNSPPFHLAPRHIVVMSPEQPYALVIDTTRSRLFVYQNDKGEPRYVTDYYISSGKNGGDKLREGDQKTPVGVYQIVANLSKSMLTDFYGPSAFPLSYPNEWDRREGRDGYGIWLHGTPSDTYSRPPRASNGCVVLTNEDLLDVAKYVSIGTTPVVISNRLDWVEPDEWRAQREEILSAIEQWRHDWESLDVDRYLANYGKTFNAEGKNLAAWSAQKHAVNAGKTFIKVAISNLSVYSYPGLDNMVVVDFDQDYKSNNLNNQVKKRQYWLHDDNRWQIVYEGSPEVLHQTVARKHPANKRASAKRTVTRRS